ncbi:MAG TPA: hypothetical protein VGD98_25775 [Ktedonobacteraceae bacterium]
MNSESPSLLARSFWATLAAGPLLICALIFLMVMISIYNTQIAIRLPTDELKLYITEMVAVGAIMLACIVLALLGIFALKQKRKIGLYAAGVVLFIVLFIIFESFISASTTVYAIQPHLEVTRAGFSPAQMSIFTDDKLHISNASDNGAQTLYVSAATSTSAIPTQLRQPDLTLQPGQSVDVVFSSGGRFTLVTATTPHLTLTITVVEVNSNGFDVFPGNG